MATYNLGRFAHADGLKAIAREHLLALLNPHKPYFDGRGLTLPPPSASDGIDYDQLVIMKQARPYVQKLMMRRLDPARQSTTSGKAGGLKYVNRSKRW